MPRIWLWDTEAEARAFAAGVEYANDSALTVDGIGPIIGDRGWLVSLTDDDAESEDPSLAVRDQRTDAGAIAERVMAASIRAVS